MVNLKVGDKIHCTVGTVKVNPLSDEPEYHYVVLNDCQLQRKDTEWKNAQPLEKGVSFWNIDGLQGTFRYSGSTLEEHEGGVAGDVLGWRRGATYLGGIELTANRWQSCTITTENIFEGAVRAGVRSLLCTPLFEHLQRQI